MNLSKKEEAAIGLLPEILAFPSNHLYPLLPKLHLVSKVLKDARVYRLTEGWVPNPCSFRGDIYAR